MQLSACIQLSSAGTKSYVEILNTIYEQKKKIKWVLLKSHLYTHLLNYTELPFIAVTTSALLPLGTVIPKTGTDEQKKAQFKQCV